MGNPPVKLLDRVRQRGKLQGKLQGRTLVYKGKLQGRTLVYKLTGYLNYDIWFACHANQE